MECGSLPDVASIVVLNYDYLRKICAHCPVDVNISRIADFARNTVSILIVINLGMLVIVI